MLDTRKIADFIEPQRIIELSNKCGRLQFSNWDGNSRNFIVTKLLAKHIAMILTEWKNRAKLYDTGLKLGFKPGEKILFLKDFDSKYCLFEAISDTEANCSIGEIGSDSWVYVTGIYRLIEKQSVEIALVSISRELLINKTEFNEYLEAMTLMYMYLHFVEVETVHVEPKETFNAKKFEGFKNQQGVSLTVADLSWSKETVLQVPFGVSGHIRNQPFGEGKASTKLIYIEPYLKGGFARKSGKERVLGHK